MKQRKSGSGKLPLVLQQRQLLKVAKRLWLKRELTWTCHGYVTDRNCEILACRKFKEFSGKLKI